MLRQPPRRPSSGLVSAAVQSIETASGVCSETASPINNIFLAFRIWQLYCIDDGREQQRVRAAHEQQAGDGRVARDSVVRWSVVNAPTGGQPREIQKPRNARTQTRMFASHVRHMLGGSRCDVGSRSLYCASPSALHCSSSSTALVLRSERGEYSCSAEPPVRCTADTSLMSGASDNE
jgi:hypothetical protein